MAVCPKCYSSDYIEVSGLESICTRCDVIVDTSDLVNDITFTETASGGAAVFGTFYSNEMSKTSRELTLERSRENIVEIYNLIGVKREGTVDSALTFYKWALGCGLTRGRDRDVVSSCCLYAAYRKEALPVLLIDLADCIKKSIYLIGRTFYVFCKEMMLEIPTVDPSLYIKRFAGQFCLGDKVEEVGDFALVLVQRMKNDWIVTGRSPAGICGAALVAAARTFGFERSALDAVPIVGISERTIQKRIREFVSTPSSHYTKDELVTIDLDNSTNALPPAFVTGLKKEKEKKDRMEQEKRELEQIQKIKEMEESMGETQEDGDKRSSKKRNRSKKSSSSGRKKKSSKSDRRKKKKKVLEVNDDLKNEIDSMVSRLAAEFADVNPDLTPKTNIPSSNPQEGAKKEYNYKIEMIPVISERDIENLGYVDGVPHLDEEGYDTFSDIDEDEMDGYLFTEEEIEFREKLWLFTRLEQLRIKEEKMRTKRENESLFGTKIRRKKGQFIPSSRINKQFTDDFEESEDLADFNLLDFDYDVEAIDEKWTNDAAVEKVEDPTTYENDYSFDDDEFW